MTGPGTGVGAKRSAAAEDRGDGDPHVVAMAVRDDDLDVHGHVRSAAYLAYADHARWERTRAAGITLDALRACGVGPVNLETTIRYERELRAGDRFDVTTTSRSIGAKTARVTQTLTRDGALVATVESVTGLLDLETRRLVPDPEGTMRAAAPHGDGPGR